VFARDIHAVGAMQVLLRDAIDPNLVQTMEGTPRFVHGGPFANIAQGTNTAIATKMALKLSDYVVTEAGFATDLGAEKFFHIKCRLANLTPAAAVIVATCRAVEYHGGFPRTRVWQTWPSISRTSGCSAVTRSWPSTGSTTDKPAQLRAIVKFCEKNGVEAVVADHFQQGRAGGGRAGRSRAAKHRGQPQEETQVSLSASMPLDKKIETIAGRSMAQTAWTSTGEQNQTSAFGAPWIRRTAGVHCENPAVLSDEPGLRGRPKGFRITVNSLTCPQVRVLSSPFAETS